MSDQIFQTLSGEAEVSTEVPYSAIWCAPDRVWRPDRSVSSSDERSMPNSTPPWKKSGAAVAGRTTEASWTELGEPGRFALHEVHDAHQDAGADQGHDERDDQTRRLGTEDQGEDEAADERPDYAEDDVPDDAVAVATHDLAGEPADDCTEDQKADQMHVSNLRLIRLLT